MSRLIFRRHIYLVLLTLGAVSAFAADPPAEKTDQKEKTKAAASKESNSEAAFGSNKKDNAEADEPKLETKTVKKGPFRIVVELEGVFEGDDAKEIIVSPDEWSKLTVLKAARHGDRVRKGDVLIELETEKLDREIANLRDELILSGVAIGQAEKNLRTLEKTTPMDLELSRRAAKLAEEDRKFYFEVAKPFNLRAAEFSLKSAQEALEYQEEELRQLEKMYKADDITEETEAIVLKRARDALARAKFMLEYSKINHDYTIKFAIPRKEEEVKELTKRVLLEAEKAEATLPLALEKQRLELEKMRHNRKQSDERLEKLTADREKMTVRSPADGIVYYGQITRGQPADSAAMEGLLRPQGNLPPNQVAMTVVSPRPMRLRATVSEGDLNDLRPGLKGTAVPTGYPELKLPVEIDRVGDIPIAPGKFDGRLNVQLKDKSKLLMPGMTCKIKLVPYQKTDAILVPPKVIVPDELDDEKQYVEVIGKDGKPARRPVTVGRKTDKRVEILKGLQEGEKVVLDPSKDKD